jgi:hypothetical protein
MYLESILKPMSRWYHPRTDSYYTVICVGKCSTNGPDENKRRDVVYWSDTMQEHKTREISEFLDGRFVPLGPGGAPLPPEISLKPPPLPALGD